MAARAHWVRAAVLSNDERTNELTMHHDDDTTTTEHADRGATGVEYALIASLIAAIIAATVAFLGLDVLDNWGSISW